MTAPVPADGGAATGGLGEEARQYRNPDGTDEQHRPLYLLCYFQPLDGRIVGCDRVKGHLGPHSWETEALIAQARAEGAAEARRDAITRLTGFGVDPAVIEHFRSLLPQT